ncbi:ACP phosphodiesterase [Halovibrio salipaludis]|uniref:ACP phosphodiesterase n=1 Tax=Halovibrio salipaludis TaxID=2032626 RepID=A0A2A2F4M5_9GAMM|nr:acyl carrier protein phosphodiesterase [Halovibrio salipaludis]PAU80541.1 ACP phosphodiesterase [Halovibrio salipaludis]
MNHLAHLFLAPDSPEARVGSILGDFCRGVRVQGLPEQVQLGVRHHLSVDGYTDRHPQVLASRRLFSSRRRRFAGVALDILYDHYLLRYWPEFSGRDPDAFIRQVYRELREHEHLMPDPMIRVTRRITLDDWFGHYRDFDSIGYALDRVAGRIRFPNRFEGIIEEIHHHNEELEARFLRFFRELQRDLGVCTQATRV